MIKVSTDNSKELLWVARRGTDNVLSFNFTSSSLAFDISGYTFSLYAFRFGAEYLTLSNAVLSLTQGSGLTNSGVTGVLTATITHAQSSSLTAKDYFFYLKVVKTSDSTVDYWFNGKLQLNKELWIGEVSTSVSTSINLTTQTIAVTIDLGGSGASTFISLTDTPNSYSGQTLKYVRVNAGETGLEFTSAAGFTLTNGSGTTANGTAVDLGGELQAGFADITMTGSDELKEFAIHSGPIAGETAGATYLYISNILGTSQLEIVSNSDGDQAINSRFGATGGGISMGLHNNSEVAQLSFTADTELVSFFDSRSTPKGIEYFATGYVTQTHSLTDKEYADGHLSGKILPTAPAAGQTGQSLRWNNSTPAWEYYTPGTGTLTSVTGTTNRITSSGGTTPAIDISASYVGQSSITTLGTIGTGTWNATTIGAAKGGTGIANNAASTITISGSFATTFTITNTTGVTLPTTGTLATLAGSESLTNKKLGSLTTNGFVKVGSGDGTLSSGPDLTTTFSAANTITGTATNTLAFQFDGLNTTLTNGAGTYYKNTTAAASGLQQISPIITLEGQGWKTTATAASQAVAFAMYTLPVQGAANPTAQFTIGSSINGSAYATRLLLTDAGVMQLLGSSNITLSPGGNNITFSAAGTVAATTAAMTLSASSTSGNILLQPNNTTRLLFAANDTGRGDFTGKAWNITQPALTSAWAPALAVAVGAHTGMTTATEFSNYTFGGAIQTAASGTTATQRNFYIQRNTYAGTSGTRTVTNPYGLYVEDAAAGTNGALTNNYAIGADGSIALVTAGNKIYIKEGTGGSLGQTTLVSGVKAITISGLTTNSRAIVTLVTPSGVASTVTYQAVCTANTLTIQANVAAGTINTADGSTLNYLIIQPTP